MRSNGCSKNLDVMPATLPKVMSFSARVAMESVVASSSCVTSILLVSSKSRAGSS